MSQIVFYILSALLVIAPLIFSPRSSELFEFPKILVIYFFAALLLPLVIIKIYELKQKFKILNSKFLILVLSGIGVFLLSQILAFFFSIDQHVSLFGYYSRFNGGLFSLFSYLTIFFAALLYLNKKYVLSLLKITLGVAIIIALWTLPSHFGYDFICLIVLKQFNTACWTAQFIPEQRIFGTLGQPNWYATYLLISIFIALFFIVVKQRLFSKKYERINLIINIVVFLLLSIELIWTKSRAGLVAYLILAPVFAIGQLLINKKLRTKNEKGKATIKNAITQNAKYIKWLIIPIYLIVFISQLYPFISQRLHVYTFTPSRQTAKTVSNIQDPVSNAQDLTSKIQHPASSNVTASSDIRLVVWQGAWQLGLKHPLFGTGPETFAYSYYSTRPQTHNLTSEWNYVYNKAHNELLNYLANTGFIGLFSYLFMFAIFLIPAIYVLFKSKAPHFALDKVGASAFAEATADKSRGKQNPSSTIHYLRSNIQDLRSFSLAYLCIMFAIFITNFFGFSTTVTSLYFYLLPALLLVILFHPTSNIKHPTSKFRPLHLGIYIIYILFISVYLVNYFSADFNYARGKEYKQINELAATYQKFDRAISLRKEPVYLDQQAQVNANLAASQKVQKNDIQADQLTKQAINFNDFTLEISPKNVFYWKTRAKVYFLLSISYIENETLSQKYFQEAINALETAAKIAPTDPLIPFTYASIIIESDPAKARQLLEHTLRLKPDFDKAQELLEEIS